MYEIVLCRNTIFNRNTTPHDGMLLSMKDRDEMDIISTVKKFPVLYAENHYHCYFFYIYYQLTFIEYTTYMPEIIKNYLNIFPHLTL